jgi:hypothetical protein
MNGMDDVQIKDRQNLFSREILPGFFGSRPDGFVGFPGSYFSKADKQAVPLRTFGMKTSDSCNKEWKSAAERVRKKTAIV